MYLPLQILIGYIIMATVNEIPSITIILRLAGTKKTAEPDPVDGSRSSALTEGVVIGSSASIPSEDGRSSESRGAGWGVGPERKDAGRWTWDCVAGKYEGSKETTCSDCVSGKKVNPFLFCSLTRSPKSSLSPKARIKENREASTGAEWQASMERSGGGTIP
jgi:hypothetical protein